MRLDLHGGVFEFRLFGCGAKRRGGQSIHAQARLALGIAPAQHLWAPVHRDEGLQRGHLMARLHGQHQAAALAAHLGQVAIFQPQTLQVLWVHLHAGFGAVGKQSACRAGARHAVPLIAQAARGQGEREL